MSEILSTFGVDWRLIFIQAVNFGLLLLILWYFLYHPVLRMIEKRQGKIEQGVKDAEEAEVRLSKVDEQKEEIIKDATVRAGILVEEAKHHGDEKGEEILRDAAGKSERIVDDARKRAQEIKKQAFEESKEEIARLAVLGAERILREKKTT